MDKPVVDATEEIDRIRREMARIRHELHFDVQQTVAGVRSLTDITSYIRNAPWLSMGLAVAVGYILVPQRTTEGRSAESVSYVAPPTAEPPRKKGSLLRSAMGLFAPLAIRAVQQYLLQTLESFMASSAMAPGGPPPASQAETTRPKYTSPRSSGTID